MSPKFAISIRLAANRDSPEINEAQAVEQERAGASAPTTVMMICLFLNHQ
jgi:hypothetical protein